MHKLRDHISKVEVIRHEQADKRKLSAEKLKTDLENKLDHAAQKREEQLEHVKNIAHHSAEKKKSSANVNMDNKNQ